METYPTRARSLMNRFAAETGVTGDGASRRYLWTDAFAVCNWIALGEVERARSLVDAVHHTLGRHREDDPRTGWISGLPDDEASARPTAGGLRIGKPRPERGPEDRHDPQLEWERDGQYFHYLTRWIRALERMAAATGEVALRRWAKELGVVAYERFSHGIGPAPNRLYWKMSIDLSRPLVSAMGEHDALDGYVAMREARVGESSGEAIGGDDRLDTAIDGLAGMADASDLATQDALGAGALLCDALALAHLSREGIDPVGRRLLQRVVHAASISLQEVRDTRFDELPASRRLAFRELGLAIGLAAAESLEEAVPDWVVDGDVAEDLASIRRALPARRRIIDFWMEPGHQRAVTWTEHPEISTVMLATALVPGGYLGPAG